MSCYNLYNKKPNVFFNFGKVCEPEIILNEINNIYNDNEYFEKGTRSYGWEGIPLINRGGDNTRDGVLLKYNTSNALPNYEYKYTDFLKKSKILQNLITKIEAGLNSKCFFARVLKLKKGGKIFEHTDGCLFNNIKYRLHIMLTNSSPLIYMFINNDRYIMKSGYLYNTNVAYNHSVINDSDYDRINIVMDFFASDILKKFTPS